MESYERERIAELARGDEGLRRLWEEHQQLERRLAELDALPHLSPQEQAERKRLQKRKLAGKDRIAEIVAKSA
jgi:uncharacterized protein YdcH (DUF465 family)